MATRKLENYLRASRRRAGLTQREVAFLLGHVTRLPVSYYENRKSVPPLKTQFAYEALFGIPIQELFAGMREEVKKEVEKKLQQMELQLQSKSREGTPGRLNAHKLRWLAERRSSLALSNNQAA